MTSFKAWFTNTPSSFSHNRLLQILISVFVCFWGVLAISPTDRKQWLLENILLVLLLLLLSLTYRKFPLSNLSYILIFIFLCLHTYGAHYTYQRTHIDLWLKNTFHTHRSYYDRIVHFAFGLFGIYPFREMLLRRNLLRGIWSFIIPVAFSLSLSAIFEIIEMLVGILAGQVGQEYQGLQGDIFDSEKDMSLAFCGAVIAAAVLAISPARSKQVKR